MTVNLTFNEDVLVSDLDGEAVLLNVKTERYFGLDEVGVMFYRALSKHQSVDPAVKELDAYFQQGEEQIRKDLLVLLEDLKKADIVLIGK